MARRKQNRMPLLHNKDKGYMNTNSTVLEGQPANIPAPLPVLTPPLPAPKPLPAVTAADVSPVLGKVATLSKEEAAMLEVYESTITKSWKATLDKGLALKAIRDDKLFRNEFITFDDYYRGKWGFACRKVYAWITAAELFTAITARPDLPPPSNEYQLRPMFGLTGPQAQVVWQCAAVLSHGFPITARDVKSALRKLQLKEKPVAALGRISKSKQRKVVGDAIVDLIVLARQKADYAVLITKLEGLDHEFRLLTAPAVSKTVSKKAT